MFLLPYMPDLITNLGSVVNDASTAPNIVSGFGETVFVRDDDPLAAPNTIYSGGVIDLVPVFGN